MLALVTGATGFVGREVVKELHRSGYKIRVLARSPEKAAAQFKSIPLEIYPGDITQPQTLEGAMHEVKAIIHLVGIIVERPGASFEDIHVQGTKNLVQAATRAGIQRFIHMSAIGTRPHAVSRYHQTKWLAEEIVRQAPLQSTIFRPSFIFGPEDHIRRMFAQMLAFPLLQLQLWTIPCPGDDSVRVQPIHVTDVARALVRSIAHPASVGETYELCGQEMRFVDMVKGILHQLGAQPSVLDRPLYALPLFLPVALLTQHKPIIVRLPMSAAYVAASLFSQLDAALRSLVRYLPPPPITLDQVIMLDESARGDGSKAVDTFKLDLTPFPCPA